MVVVAVEGSQARPVSRSFFASGAYDTVSWRVAEVLDELVLMELISHGGLAPGTVEIATRLALDRRLVNWELADSEATEARQAHLQVEAAERLLDAGRAVVVARQWPTLLQDLDAVVEQIERESDRWFIVRLAGQHRRWFGIPFTEPQQRWLEDIFRRTARQLLPVPPPRR